MNIFTAMMIAVTVTMTAVMVPRIYLSWLMAEAYRIEGEVEALQDLLAEQNRWVARQFFCGTAAFALIWMVKTSRHDLGIPDSMAATLAAYAVISMVFAVCESLVAQKVSSSLLSVPVAVRVKVSEEK